MPSSRSCERAAFPILTAMIRGENWTASSVRNPILRKNYRRLGRTFCRSHRISDALCQPALQLVSIIVERSELLSAPHDLKRHLIPALLRVISYADRWIRSPESWEPDQQNLWSSLLNHLFVRWEVPRFFESAWLTKGSLCHLERNWFCDIATGLSWRKLEGVPASTSKRAIHLAMQAPNEFTPRQALRWGQLKALGASSELIEEVLKSVVVNNLSNEEIWSRLFEKVVQNHHFDVRDFTLIADVFEELYRRYQFNRARDLISLPLSELLNHCRHYWSVLLKDSLADGLKFRTHDLQSSGLRRDLTHFTNAQWEPMAEVEDEELVHRAKNGSETTWQIMQLTRPAQLVAEGLAMNHCVGSYRRSCQGNYSAIFALGEIVNESSCRRVIRKATFEVFPKHRWIVQAKGRWNDPLETLEHEVISKWANRNQIRYRSA